MLRYGLILLLICFSASFVLSLTYKVTQAKIAEQVTADEKAALERVFPEASTFEEKTLEDQNYYLAKKDGTELGYVIKTTAKGYASDIVMMVGFDRKGTIEGVEIVSQQETPGLGAKIAEVKAGEKDPWFLRQFDGKKIDEVDLNTIHAITAATITSTAVVSSVRKAVEDFLAKVK